MSRKSLGGRPSATTRAFQQPTPPLTDSDNGTVGPRGGNQDRLNGE